MSDDDRAGIGGKAAALHELSRSGFAIPPWRVLDTSLFDRMTALVDPDLTDPARRLLDAPMPPEIEECVLRAYRELGEGAVAVRSSATAEDGAVASFAGVFTTRLNVAGDAAVVAAVRQCWASAFSDNVAAYTGARGLDDHLKMAVILQRMVSPDISGVLFTRDTVHDDDGSALVSTVYGLGEGLVSGEVDADSIVVDRRSGAVAQVTLGDKQVRLVPADSGGVESVAVAHQDRTRVAISDAQLMELTKVGAEIERLMNAPQDIEWAFQDGDLWILQSRPISVRPTSGIRRTADQTMRIWDNSNIVESFGGVSSPLTFTLANYIYHQVYVEYYRLLGVPQRDLDAAVWMRNMLGYLNGRIYYNLLNWYKMLRVLPLYGPNRRLFEVGLGVEEPLEDAIADAITAFDGRSAVVRGILRLRVAVRFAMMWLRSSAHVKEFLEDFYAAFAEFDAADYTRMDPATVYQQFLAFERRILSKWGRMLALETVIGLTYVPLRLLTRWWMPGAPDWFSWEVAKPPDGLESVEPAEELRALGDLLARCPAALAVVTGGGDMDELRARGEGVFWNALDQYLNRFGYRSANELKIEAPTLREEPAPLLTALRARIEQRRAGDVAAERTDVNVEQMLRESLGVARRFAYGLLRRKVQRSLAARERVRFCRTRAFGVVKSMMRAVGAGLAREGVLGNADDVYLLRLEELRGLFEGLVDHHTLRQTAELRRRELARAEAIDMPSRFRTTGAIYPSMDRLLAAAGDTPTERASEGTVFYGTPSCPGVVQAGAHVTHTPTPPNGCILVAYSTDPSWVTVLTSAKGLVIERGSPLTHVAIIAREMNIPTVTKVPGIMAQISTGYQLRLDGAAGRIDVLSTEPAADA